MNFHNSKEKHLYHTFSAILFSLIPLFLVTGPFLADLSISLINILFLVYCLKKKNFSFFKKESKQKIQTPRNGHCCHHFGGGNKGMCVWIAICSFRKIAIKRVYD